MKSIIPCVTIVDEEETEKSLVGEGRDGSHQVRKIASKAVRMLEVRVETVIRGTRQRIVSGNYQA